MAARPDWKSREVEGTVQAGLVASRFSLGSLSVGILCTSALVLDWVCVDGNGCRHGCFLKEYSSKL